MNRVGFAFTVGIAGLLFVILGAPVRDLVHAHSLVFRVIGVAAPLGAVGVLVQQFVFPNRLRFLFASFGLTTVGAVALLLRALS